MFFRTTLALALSSLTLLQNAEAQTAPGSRRDAPVRGVVRPVDQAAISTDLSIRVVRLTRKEGEAFNKGDLLVEFDCRKQISEGNAAEAAFREAKIAHQSALYLQRNQAGAKFDVDTAQARADKTGAEAEALKSRLDQCSVIAPFTGRVAELAVHEHEMPQPGKPFITILDDSTLEIELIVPSVWLRWMKNGTPFTFRVDETGGSFESKIVRVAAAVDPVSQTVKAVGSIAKPDGKVLAGMSGTAEFAGGL